MVVCGFLESTWTENGSDAVSVVPRTTSLPINLYFRDNRETVMAHQPFRSLEAMDPLEKQ